MKVPYTILLLVMSSIFSESLFSAQDTGKAPTEKSNPTVQELVKVGKLSDAIVKNWPNLVEDINMVIAEAAAPDGKSSTPLEYAVRSNDLESTKTLLALGANPNLQPYLVALAQVNQPNIEIARALVEAGADVNRATRASQDTALMFAVAQRSIPLIEYLLSQGANPAFQNSRGKTALQIAQDMQHIRRNTAAKLRVSIKPGDFVPPMLQKQLAEVEEALLKYDQIISLLEKAGSN